MTHEVRSIVTHVGAERAQTIALRAARRSIVVATKEGVSRSPHISVLSPHDEVDLQNVAVAP